MGFKNIETRRKYQRRYYHERMAGYREVKGNKCEFCGWDDVVEVLEFAHIDEKKFCISKNLKKPASEVLEELKKCYLLCPNCHRIYDSLKALYPNLAEEIGLDPIQ